MHMAGDQAGTFQRVMEGFLRVVDVPEAQRAERLDEVCNGDEAVRAQILAMLKADATPTGIGAEVGERLDHAGAGAQLLADAIHVDESRLVVERPRVLSDRYRILGLVGEGGMGMVYEAMQVYPPRRVALKALRPGLQSRSLLKRFAHEAAVLARLQHPGIAQIYDAGASDPTSPDQAFIVMEFVDGKPIIEHARAAGLDVIERVRLMALVCDAVQHAHQRGVIHRDLKPSNVMVDSTGQPKVLDFGVARLASDEPSVTTMHTVDGQMVGTLGYMSPEQVDGEANKIDATTDVYALGVMLYELLAERPAFLLHGKPMAEAARLVKTLTPPPLSSIAQQCRGDLETIVATAMHREQSRRYHSAAALANDLRRYIGGEAIEARRDSSLYLLQKSLVRYRWAVRAGIAAVIGFASFGVYWARQAVKERELALLEVEAREKATAALDVAERRRQQVDDLSLRLKNELIASRLERARLEAQLGKGSSAEALVMSELLSDPENPQAWWALREHFGRFPCLWEAGSLENATSLAVDSSARIAAVGSNTGQVAILSLRDGRTIARADLRDFGSVRQIVISPSADSCVVGGYSGTISILDIPPGILDQAAAPAAPSAPEASDSAVPSLAVRKQVRPQVGYPMVLVSNPAKSKIVVGGGTDELRVYEAANLDHLLDFKGPSGVIATMTMDRAGRAAIATREGTLSVRSAVDGSIIAELPHVADAPGSLSFSNDGKAIFIGTRDRSVLQWTIGEPEVTTLVTGLTGLVVACESAPNDQRMLIAAGPSLQIARPDILAAPQTIGYHQGSIQAATWIGDDGMLTLSYSGTLKRWEGHAWPSVRPLNRDGKWQVDIDVARVGDRTVLISGDLAGYAAAIDADSGEVLWRHTFEFKGRGRDIGIHRVRAIAYASGIAGDIAFFGLNDATVRVMDLRTGTLLSVIEFGALECSDLAITPDGMKLAILDSSQTLSLWDVSDPRQPRAMEHERSGKANTSDHFSSHEGRTESGRDERTSEPMRVGLPTATQFDRTVVFSADQASLLVGTETSVQLLDAMTLEPFAALAIPSGARCVATHSSGLLAIGLSDARVMLLDRARPGTAPLIAQTSHISAAATAINHDASIIAAGGDDGTISLWSRSDMQQLCIIPLGMGEVCAMKFMDDRDRLAVATRRGVVVVDPYHMDAAIAASLPRMVDGRTEPDDPRRDVIRRATMTMLRP